MKRSAEEVEARCSSIMKDKNVVNLVMTSSSPSAAYEMIFAETKNIAKAKAGRWLAVLRRDYSQEYQKILSTKLSQAI